MPSIFTRILAGEVPGRIVYEDANVFALLTRNPIRPGHTLVIPKREVDHWIDLTPEENAQLFEVARRVGQGLQRAFSPAKVGVALVGLEVRHVHVHLVPIESVGDLDFAKQDLNPKESELDAAAESLRAALRALGETNVR